MTTYLEHLPSSGLRPKTIAETSASIRRFNEWLDVRPITGGELMAYREHVARRHLAPRTKNLELARVAAMARWMSKRHQVDLEESQIAEACKPFPVDTQAPRVLSKDEIQRLAKACEGSETGRTVLALLVTGARHQEILSLNRSNLGEQGIEIKAEQSKNRRGRVIPWFIVGSRRDLFMPLPFVWDRHQWEAIREQAGLSIPVKALRSTWVSYAAYAGKMPLVAVAKLAGHTVDVCEANYLGAPIFGITGESAPEWMGLEAPKTTPETAANAPGIVR